MLRSLLIGLTSGSRSLTPLAVVSQAAQRGELPADSGAPAWLSSRRFGAALKLMAAGELFGDKLRSAPDRIVPAGILARVVTGGLAGAALAPRRRLAIGALLGSAAAVGAAYVTFGLRMRAMRRFGQASTGLVEDAVTLGAAEAVVKGAR